MGERCHVCGKNLPYRNRRWIVREVVSGEFHQFCSLRHMVEYFKRARG